MRPLETLLVLANLLAFFVLLIPFPKSAGWLVGLAVMVGVLLAGQLLLEGPRWQMVPAYLLAGLFSFLLLLRRAGFVADPRWKTPSLLTMAAGLGVLALAVSVIFPLLLPVFQLPRPTGRFGIGTLTYHWVDAARPEVFTAAPDDRRELMVQIWYPARQGASQAGAPYVQNPEVLAPLTRLLHLPGFLFDHLKYVRTHAVPAAPADDEQASYPVLIFLSGRGGYRQSNTFQVEELVSHGYIVVGIDQPYAAAGVVFPDGRLVTMDARLFDPARPGHAAFLDEVLPFLAQDVSFTLDQLTALNQMDPQGILAGKLDLSHAGIFGISLGGIVTGEACLGEPRLRACLVMDAFMPADVVRSGLQQPTLWLSRDAQTMQREGWMQADIDETQSSMRRVYDTLPGAGYLVLVPNMFHTDFTDATLISPLGRLAGISGPIDARRARGIVNAYSLAFFDQFLKEEPADILDHLAEQYPEVLVTSRQP